MEEDVFVPDEEMTPEAIVVTVHKAWGRSPEGAIIMRLTHNLKEDGGVEQEYFYMADDEFGPLVPELTRMLAAKEVDLFPWQDRPVPVPTVPQVVSRFQARAALYTVGLLAAVEAAIADAEPLVQMAWVDAQEFRRDSPTILALATVLSLSGRQVDDLFIAAAQIVA